MAPRERDPLSGCYAIFISKKWVDWFKQGIRSIDWSSAAKLLGQPCTDEPYDAIGEHSVGRLNTSSHKIAVLMPRPLLDG